LKHSEKTTETFGYIQLKHRSENTRHDVVVNHGLPEGWGIRERELDVGNAMAAGSEGDGSNIWGRAEDGRPGQTISDPKMRHQANISETSRKILLKHGASLKHPDLLLKHPGSSAET
jgi:hypothetical protein